MIRALVAIVAAFVASSGLAATPVPGGKWSFVWTDTKGRADRPMRVYTYRPRKCDSTCPMVFVLHGQKRNAAEFRDNWQSLADHYSFLVIAPEFTQKNWPRAAGYNLGDAGEHKDRERWGFSAVEHLFDEMRVDQTSYVLFGHGAGGQFAQRFALLRPDNRASVIIVANAAWYTLPEWRKDKTPAAFPYSLVNAPVGEAELRQALAHRLVVMAGDRDDDADDESQDKNDGAAKQGDGRVDRAENFFKAATTAAQDLGVKLAWDLVEVPERVRDGEHFGTAAADMLFEKK